MPRKGLFLVWAAFLIHLEGQFEICFSIPSSLQYVWLPVDRVTVFRCTIVFFVYLLGIENRNLRLVVNIILFEVNGSFLWVAMLRRKISPPVITISPVVIQDLP